MITTQKVHSVLRRAGFTKALWLPSHRVRGWGHWSAGYAVDKDWHGNITVRHINGEYGPDRTQEMQPKYEAALRVHFNVTRVGDESQPDAHLLLAEVVR